ncbi:MAG: HNH endonuclease [Deltaproteobacteria bacterium]|nr:HNH endonuclease [Deltaproteobacteria bacterium]
MSHLAARPSFARVPAGRPRLVACARAEAERVRVVERERLAIDIDRGLRVACRTEASARLTIGMYADLLLGRRSYGRLGFARLADYARERLGLSARAVEEAAFVARRLADRPRIAAEFHDGTLSWTQLRLLVGVATAATESAWVRLARTRSIDVLSATVAAHRSRNRSAAVEDFDDDLIDGEPVAVLRIECPGRIRRLWRHACELASRMAGAPLPAWRAAEAIAAEGIAARPMRTTIADRVIAALLRVKRRAGRGDRQSVAAPVVDIEIDPSLADLDRVAEPTANDLPLADTAPSLAPPAESTDPHEIDARLVAALHTLRTVEPRIGRLLRVLVDHHLYRALGFRSLDAYVRERLGLSTRKVWALVRIERGVRRAAPFAAAYEEGRLSWARTLALLPVVDRTTADAWLARANAVTVRRLQDEVAWVLDRRDLDGPFSSLLPPLVESPLGVQIGACPSASSSVTKIDTGTIEIAESEVRFAGPVSVTALMRDALGIFASAGEPRWRALERLLLRVIVDWEAESPHRDPVFTRDGWRCTVPGCSSRRNLHDHHVRFRSRGGGNQRSNRTTVCAAHHLHGIHAGIIRVAGTAPDGLRWDLPLFSCIGDRYV